MKILRWSKHLGTMDASFLKTVTKPIYLISVAAVIAVVSIGVAYIATTPHPSGSYVTPTLGTIVEEVDAPGTVTPAETVALSFDTGGTIAFVGPAVGQHVAAGATLASLSGADLAAALEQAKAGLAEQQANLAGLEAGASAQDIAVSQTAVTGAQMALSQANQGIVQASQTAYVESDDAIHNKVDQFFNNPRTSSPSLVFALSDSQAQSSIVSGRTSMETILSAWQAYLAALPTGADSVDTADVVTTTQGYLSQIGSYLDLVSSGLTEVIPNSSYPEATIQTYQTNVATGRANVSAAMTAINAAQTQEKSDEAALASAQSELTLTQAPPTATAVAAQQAQVAGAQADVDAAQAQLNNTVISAPFSGTVTQNDAHIGETAAPGSVLISMISDAQFQFDVYVSQADIAKVKTGDSADIILDAYQSGAPFPAHVITVDPAATVANGISSYKVTLQFDQNDPRIDAGLTGNVQITTHSDNNVLSVPASAVITQGSDTFVMRQSPSGDQMVPVTTGIESAAGMIEITSGLSGTDRIRTFGAQPQ